MCLLIYRRWEKCGAISGYGAGISDWRSQRATVGIEKPIEISFFSPNEGEKRYPSVSTCFYTLCLPRGITDKAAFAEYMDEAIVQSPGFGKI